MCQLWILFLLIILRINGGNTTNSNLSQMRICQLRCVAKCVIDDKNDKIGDKKICWETCDGNINEGPKPEIPKDIKWFYTPSYSINITWIGDGTLYLLKMIKKIGNNEYSYHFLTTTTTQLNYTKSETNFCNPLLFQLASVTTAGISNFSNVQEIPASSPEIIENLTVKSMEYIVS
ncbi:unnamed protein product [Brugia pahangi]|uniref:Fibronectin type-III domain-containing protein n=1 Tax=Brugia pahangi TaxID=6280 RepID=A0A0N4T8G4_BRUPA|nr:unnamed protein product [Brugia pahangi]